VSFASFRGVEKGKKNWKQDAPDRGGRGDLEGGERIGFPSKIKEKG